MTERNHGHDDEQSASKAYETRDIKIRPLLVFMAGLIIVGIASYLVIFGLFRLFSAQQAAQDVQTSNTSLVRPSQAGEERLPPEPRIQENPAADLKSLRTEEDAILTTYGWVDRNAGVVRVPIGVAMKMVVDAGLPVRQPETASPATGTPAPATLPKGTQKTQKQQ